MLEGIHQAGLPDARLADDEDHLPPSVEGLYQTSIQVGEWCAAPDEVLRGKRSVLLRWQRAVLGDRGDELIAALGKGPDELRRFGAIAERTPDLQDVPAEDFRLHVRIRPDRAEQLIVSDEAPRVLDEILQHGERLGHQGDAGVSTPQALVRHVEAERIEHLATHLTTSPRRHEDVPECEQLERSADCC